MRFSYWFVIFQGGLVSEETAVWLHSAFLRLPKMDHYFANYFLCMNGMNCTENSFWRVSLF